jgi:uncharacterized protein YggU (UPF0235/DUF167 family)
VADWYRRRESGGTDLFVRLTPRSARDALGPLEETADGRCHLCARVRAVPEKGAANAALERLLAEALGLPRSRVRIIAGQGARQKTVHVEAESTALVSRLETIAGATP